jgi:hypothetical protein
MAEPFVIGAFKGGMAVPFSPHCGVSASMAEPFLCKNHLLYFSLFMAAPFANLCVSSMAEPFLCENYLLCLSLFMAAPLANLYSPNMAEPFVISALKGDMAAPFYPHFDMSANMAEPFQFKNYLLPPLLFMVAFPIKFVRFKHGRAISVQKKVVMRRPCRSFAKVTYYCGFGLNYLMLN